MLYQLGGADSLDISGRASKHAGQPVSHGTGWAHYGADAGGHRFAATTQITSSNVQDLTIAWEYRTGDVQNRATVLSRAATEATPILFEDQLVFCTPFNEIIAIQAESGEERWRFSPEVDLEQRPANQFVCRGVTHWHDPSDPDECGDRIFMATNDGRLFAVDARSGERCSRFGRNGEVAIDPGMPLWWPGEFQMTSPPVVAGGSLIVGSAISDNARVAAPAGSVRAFDVVTGEPTWSFDPIPRGPADPASASWETPGAPIEGHANVWAPMSVDERQEVVFLPTSSPSPDFYGGLRPGDNRYANSVVALDGETGQVKWSFQTVHHDVWDYDVPAQPGLYSVWKDGRWHDVVAQVTKTGFVFVLDRQSGTPFLPIVERPVPQDAAPGEALSATQPFPATTPPIVPNTLSAADAFGITWFDKRACRKKYSGGKDPRPVHPAIRTGNHHLSIYRRRRQLGRRRL